MLKHAFLGFSVLILLLSSGAAHQQARSSAPIHSPQRAPLASDAETVFATSASKIVFLIARKSGEAYKLASGVILSADGYIATNYHALQGADAVEIRLFPNPSDRADYQSFNAPKLLYADADADIAVLKVSAGSLPFLKTASGASPVRVGEKVYAIGNPKGLSNTISEGIVSALRAIDGQNLIQHTAPISPGSSGGALVDSSGAFLGMNSWQVADGQNLNFAIPAGEISEALTAARRVKTALTLPPDEPGEPPAQEPPAQQQQVRDRDWQASQSAVTVLKTLVETIKSCPQIAAFRNQWGKRANEFSQHLIGPPRNVVWDVVPNNSVRAPFSGHVEFTIPFGLHVPQESLDRFTREHPGLYEVFTGLKPQEYRYEFDIGPSGLALQKVLNRDEGQSEWRSGALPNYCWGAAARNIGSQPLPVHQPVEDLDSHLTELTAERDKWESLTNTEGVAFRQWQARVVNAKPALDKMHAEWGVLKDTIDRSSLPQSCRTAADQLIIAFDRYLRIQDKLFVVYMSVSPSAPDAQKVWNSANADYQELLVQQDAVMEDLNQRSPVMAAACKGF